jgi:hypothetical protein
MGAHQCRWRLDIAQLADANTKGCSRILNSSGERVDRHAGVIGNVPKQFLGKTKSRESCPVPPI